MTREKDEVRKRRREQVERLVAQRARHKERAAQRRANRLLRVGGQEPEQLRLKRELRSMDREERKARRRSADKEAI